MRVLVTGASGYIGSRLVAALLNDDAEVVVGSRTPAGLRSFDFYDRVTALSLDVTDSDSCAAAFARSGDIDVAYYLVHAIGESDYRAQDRRSAEQFAAAAVRAGVRRIVYLGGFVPDDDHLSEHLASRADVGEALGVDGIELVWLRAAIVMGAGSTSYEMLRYLADRLPVLPLPSWLSEPVQPIAVDDVLRYLLASASAEQVPAGSYDIGGPDVVPYRDLVFAYVEAAGLQRVGLPVPLVPTALAGKVIGKIIPVPAGLAEDLVGSLHNTMTTSESRIRDLVADPPTGLTTIADAMARSVRGMVGDPPGVCALKDPLRLADTDALWSGGDALGVRRRGIAASSGRTWDLIEALGGRRLLSSKPVAAALRTNLDVAAGISHRARAIARKLTDSEET